MSLRRILPTLLLTAVLATRAAVASAPWSVVMMEPTCSMNDICVLPDGLHGWAVGSISFGGEMLSTVVRTTDGGASWTHLPFPGETTAYLNGVVFVSPTRGWIVGEGGRIYATSDGGATWTAQAGGTSRKLSKICFINDQRGWITGGWQDGTSYLVLRTTNGGATWENRSFGSTCYSCEDVFFADAQNGWIVGQDSGIHPHIHHTTDGGLSWVRQAAPAGSGSPGGVEFVSAAEGWVSTSSLYVTPPGGILHTTNGGATWAVQAYTNLTYNYCIDARDASSLAVAAVQILTPVSEKITLSHDGGNSWTDYIPPTVNYTYGIQYVGSSIWYTCDYGQIVRSPDEGATWDWDYRAPFWRSMDWSDDQNGWLVAGSSTGTDGYCFRSTDGGTTWARDRKAPGGTQVTFVDTMNGWMLWEGTAASVWRTTDGGENWESFNIGGGWIDGIVFASAQQGWAHGANGTMRATTDGGRTWTSQSVGTTRYVDAAFFLNDHEGWCGGGYGGSNGFIRHTTNGGSTWVNQTSSGANHVCALDFLDAQNGWALGYGGYVQRTTDGGATWNFLSQVSPFYAYDIQMIDALHGWILVGNEFGGQPGEDGRGFVLETADGGSTWNVAWTSPWIMGHLYDLTLQAGLYPWVCGHHTTVLRAFDPLAVGENGTAQMAWEVYPNPVLSSARIDYAVRADGPVSIALFDLGGRRVADLFEGTQTAGAHSIIWNGSGTEGRPLPAGIYFGRLSAEDRSEVRKILVR